ncbi:MAG TPA: oxygen-independent coproporphyrinogen III oxidase [Steroidobacteraceae bacterium]|nr:oxygen-independent coproporphyrinogen III oxidase [Steroidobacteraceae bacterium]
MTTATAVAFDCDLMRRYDREGPRYTSYPTALQFTDSIDCEAYGRAAAASRGAAEGIPLSLYVHIPFCASPCFYCGCNKIVTRQLDRADAYVRLLIREISQRGAYFNRSRTVEQMHFGGGTPTFLSAPLLSELVDQIDRHFQLTRAESRDYSIEIDPRTVDESGLHLLAALGFNRLSLGVQDFDEAVQRAVNRVQSAELVARVYDRARGLGFGSINFDLIYGLPRQTLSSFAATLARVVDMRPDRLAVYGYAHLPHVFKAQRQIKSAELPDAATRLRLLELAIDTLRSAGYCYIGMDHFALPSDGLAQAQQNGTLHRSFQGYTTHADRDLVNLGVSAIGQVGNLYVQNPKSLADYQRAVQADELPAQRGVQMSRDDVLRKEVIHRLMCDGSLDIPAIECRYGIEFDRYFAPERERLSDLQADGLVELSESQIALTPAGRLLMRSVAMTFDAYILRKPPARASRLI